MFRRPVSIVFIIYVIIGIVVAWTRAYITVGLIKGVLSALLAIFLWFLPLLGVSLHLHYARLAGLGVPESRQACPRPARRAGDRQPCRRPPDVPGPRRAADG